MSNIIDSIQLSGVTYQIQGSGGGGVPESTFTAYTATTDERISQDEEVTAAGLNALNDKITPTVELTQAQYDALVTAGTVQQDTYYIITDATAVDMANYYTTAQTNSLLSGKQNTLVSGTNIKTVNNESILGSGNISVEGKGVVGSGSISVSTGTTDYTINFTPSIWAGTGTNAIKENFSNNTASGSYSHAEGFNTKATGSNSHAEGYNTTATGSFSHAEGYYTTATTNYSHAEGGGTTASGIYSHAEGYNTTATGSFSHAEGFGTITNNEGEHASGKYNVSHTGSTEADNTLFSVGNGTYDGDRRNAFEIRENGDVYIASGYTAIKLQDHLGGGGSITVDTALSSTSENPVQNKVIYNKIDEVEQVTAAGLNALNDNFGGLKLVKLSQAEYNALATKDPSTLYVIVN